MTKEEFKKAMEISREEDDMSEVDISVFQGYGLPGFGRIHVTLRQVAALIRWECLQFNGEYDGKKLNYVANTGRQRFQIIGWHMYVILLEITGAIALFIAFLETSLFANENVYETNSYTNKLILLYISGWVFSIVSIFML